MAKNVGIDLGTTNVLVNLYGKGIILNEPSVVAIDTRSQEVIAIGHEAYEMMGRTPESIQVIQPLKGGVIADFDIAEAMLMLFMQRLNLTSWFAKPNVLICAPSKVSEIERLALIETVERAGGGRIYLEEEPKVAGVGAGIDPLNSSGSMVIDIGGGTSDFAVISAGEVIASESIKLAGDDLDLAIIQYLKDNFHILVGERSAESLKKAVASAVLLPEEEVETYDVKGRDLLTGLPMEKGILLTGGGALIYHMDTFLTDFLKVSVLKAEQPMNCVAIGSGLMLDLILSGKLERTNPTWRQRLKRRLQRIKRRILG